MCVCEDEEKNSFSMSTLSRSRYSQNPKMDDIILCKNFHHFAQDENFKF